MDKDAKILVVDDFAKMREIIGDLLGTLGYKRVEEADDGATALPKLHAGDFDLLILDWNMPGMNGLELLEAMRADPELDRLPVLMVTAEDRHEQIRVALDTGIDAYIIKPFTERTLGQKLTEIGEKLAATAC